MVKRFSMAKYFDNIHTTMPVEDAIHAAARFQNYNGKTMDQVSELAGRSFQNIPEPLLNEDNYIEAQA